MMTIHKTPNPNPNRWSLNPPHPMLFNANRKMASSERACLLPGLLEVVLSILERKGVSFPL